MVDSEIWDFFDPLVDDEISRTLIRMLGENNEDENFEAILEKLIECMEEGETND